MAGSLEPRGMVVTFPAASAAVTVTVKATGLVRVEARAGKVSSESGRSK